jgi:heterodisulfide reductase subunit C
MTAVQQTVLYEQEMKLDFMQEVLAIPGGEKIRSCIQCGTCSGSCPVSWAMEETPRELFAMVRAGLRDRVLSSRTIWTCASCYQCAVRCPQQIRITDVMYILKRLAFRENPKGSQAAQVLARRFTELIERYGRNHETVLMARFLLAARPSGILRDAGVGLKLRLRGRLPVTLSAVRDIEGFRRILAKAEALAEAEENGVAS